MNMLDAQPRGSTNAREGVADSGPSFIAPWYQERYLRKETWVGCYHDRHELHHEGKSISANGYLAVKVVAIGNTLSWLLSERSRSRSGTAELGEELSASWPSKLKNRDGGGPE